MTDDTRSAIREEQAERRRINARLAECGADFLYVTPARDDEGVSTDERIARACAFFDAVPHVRNGAYDAPVRDDSYRRYNRWANGGECLHGLTRNANGNYRQGRQWHPSERGITCPLVSQIKTEAGAGGVGHLYDHMTYLLIADGRRVWLMEPYMELSPQDAQELERVFRVGSEGELDALVLGSSVSWYNPPASTLIAIAEPPAIAIIADAFGRRIGSC